MNDWNDMAAAGRDRWQTLLHEAAQVRLARSVAPVQRAPVRERVAAALLALADRLAPVVRETQAPDASVPGAGHA